MNGLHIIFNDIRYRAKKLLKDATAKVTSGAMSESDYSRLQQLSEIPYLKQEGIFGSGTEAVCRVVMGSHGTKLRLARCKRKDFYVKSEGGSNRNLEIKITKEERHSRIIRFNIRGVLSYFSPVSCRPIGPELENNYKIVLEKIKYEKVKEIENSGSL